MAAEVPPLRVVAGALVDFEDRVLITERPAGKAHAGRWEFPGGKRLEGERPRVTLQRELHEELGIEVLRSEPLLTVRHHYAGEPAAVVIECWRVTAWRGEPTGRDRQRLRWCTREQLVAADILEADHAIVTALVLPPQFVRELPDARLDLILRQPRERDRTAWLVHVAAPGPRLIDAAARHGDLLVVVAPPRPPPEGVAGAFMQLRAFVPASSRLAPAGVFVRSAEAASAARSAGADFLLVPGRGLPATELEAIAALGLPWYLGDYQGDDLVAKPTGQLHWRGPDRPGDRELNRVETDDASH